MGKIWTIAWKDVSTTFRDRNLVLVMLAAPLAVATIIALAFGGLAGGDVPIKDIPVAIVNLDKGANGQNFGDIYVKTFIPQPASVQEVIANSNCKLIEKAAIVTTIDSGRGSLQSLVKATKLDDASAAKANVDDGTY